MAVLCPPAVELRLFGDHSSSVRSGAAHHMICPRAGRPSLKSYVHHTFWLCAFMAISRRTAGTSVTLRYLTSRV
jgi:hypothetical protein